MYSYFTRVLHFYILSVLYEPPKAKIKITTDAAEFSYLAVRENADRAALRLNLTAKPLDGGQQVYRALDRLRDAPTPARLRQTKGHDRKAGWMYTSMYTR